MKTIQKIVSKVNCQYGAPMGRSNVGTKPKNQRIYDCYVPMCTCCGAYDIGGAYWGNGPRLRVSYTKDLSYIEFYRQK
jgi:hypothetical protein